MKWAKYSGHFRELAECWFLGLDDLIQLTHLNILEPLEGHSNKEWGPEHKIQAGLLEQLFLKCPNSAQL